MSERGGVCANRCVLMVAATKTYQGHWRHVRNVGMEQYTLSQSVRSLTAKERTVIQLRVCFIMINSKPTYRRMNDASRKCRGTPCDVRRRRNLHKKTRLGWSEPSPEPEAGTYISLRTCSSVRELHRHRWSWSRSGPWSWSFGAIQRQRGLDGRCIARKTMMGVVTRRRWYGRLRRQVCRRCPL